MTVYDAATKVLYKKSFPQHSIAGPISGITFIVLFSQEKPLRWKEINTHTHTHTHTHTRTHTHTHTHTNSKQLTALCQKNKIICYVPSYHIKTYWNFQLQTSFTSFHKFQTICISWQKRNGDLFKAILMIRKLF